MCPQMISTIFEKILEIFIKPSVILILILRNILVDTTASVILLISPRNTDCPWTILKSSTAHNQNVIYDQVITWIAIVTVHHFSCIYTNPMRVHCIWPSIDGGYIYIRVGHFDSWNRCVQLYTVAVVALLCVIVAFNKMRDVNPRSQETAILLWEHCSNGLVESACRILHR